MEKIINAAKIANAYEFINKLENKFDTIIGERGLKLSGGQRQGVAIARALARGREIFILDEPTAALGVEQQANVNNLILKLKEEQKTVLLISHNLEHVFEVADRLIILRRGEKVGERIKKSTNKEEIVGLITGAIK